MPPKVAAITMAYDETVLLPIWARHYARQVGADQCYVVDHGSPQTPILPRGMNTLRLPRSPHDDPRRAGFIAGLAASLLSYYDWVLYTDVDELLLADPARYAHLAAYCAAAPEATITAIGLEVQQTPDEAALIPAEPIGPQRGWVRFSSALCKPVLTRQPVAWSPGFHTADRPLGFDHLYLFHLHWADRDLGLARLERTRAMSWADPQFGAHSRMATAEWCAMFDGMARFPGRRDIQLDPAALPLQPWLARTRTSAGSPNGLDLHINAGELWAIPSRFRDRL